MPPRRDQKRLTGFGSRALFSLLVGLFVGAAYAVLGLLLAMVQGTETLVARGLTVSELLFAYLAGGFIGGAIVGLLHRVAGRNVVFAAIVGYVAAFPFTLGLGMMSERSGSDGIPFGVAAVASLVGAFVAVILWNDEFFRKLRAKRLGPPRHRRR